MELVLKNEEKENEFFSKQYSYSYSSLRKFRKSPLLFYKNYILKQKDDFKTSFLDLGSLIHFYLLEREDFEEKFVIAPAVTPSESIIQIIEHVFNCNKEKGDGKNLEDSKQLILDKMKEINLYQNLTDNKDGTGDSKRIAKVLTPEGIQYYDYICTSEGKQIIDLKTREVAADIATHLLTNQMVVDLLSIDKDTSDSFNYYNEELLEEELFGCRVKGIIDHFSIDILQKKIRIVDLKTTSKPLIDFSKSIEEYDYWMQAAIYFLLVKEYLRKFISDIDDPSWDISFTFLVIDSYGYPLNMSVTDKTMIQWIDKVKPILSAANYCYKVRDYSKNLLLSSFI